MAFSQNWRSHQLVLTWRRAERDINPSLQQDVNIWFFPYCETCRTKRAIWRRKVWTVWVLSLLMQFILLYHHLVLEDQYWLFSYLVAPVLHTGHLKGSWVAALISSRFCVPASHPFLCWQKGVHDQELHEAEQGSSPVPCSQMGCELPALLCSALPAQRDKHCLCCCWAAAASSTDSTCATCDNVKDFRLPVFVDFPYKVISP